MSLFFQFKDLMLDFHQYRFNLGQHPLNDFEHNNKEYDHQYYHKHFWKSNITIITTASDLSS